MIHIIPRGAGRQLDLPGRRSTEVASQAEGGHQLTVRRVEIPAARPGTSRNLHIHRGCEEVILILSGHGRLREPAGAAGEVHPGDLAVIPADLPHATEVLGAEPLVCICFFPVPDVAAITVEDVAGSDPPAAGAGAD